MTLEEELRRLRYLARVQAPFAPTLEEALERVARMPYGFAIADGDHVMWSTAEMRGYAACGEAAAFLAAAALRDGHRVELVLEGGADGPCGPRYRHAVVLVDGVRLDPYAAWACPTRAAPLVVEEVRL